jgi:hypothetical protein
MRLLGRRDLDLGHPIVSKVRDYLFKRSCGASFQHLKAEVGGDVTSIKGAEPSHMHDQTVSYVMMSPLYQPDHLTKVGHSLELPIQKTLR